MSANQASVSKLERRTDMYISTLRGVIEAMGGQLEITAIFRDGAIRITLFEELDFVLRFGETVVAIEVKSGRRRAELPGFDAFTKSFRPNHVLLVGGQGIPLEEFLGTPAGKWVGK